MRAKACSIIKSDRSRRRLNRTKTFHFPILIGLIFISLTINSFAAESGASPDANGRIDLYFFYTEDCQPCQTILQSYLPSLKAMVPSLEIKTFNIGKPAYYEALSKLEKQFNRNESELPVVLIGDHLLSGESEIMEKLNPLLFEYQAKDGALLPPLPTGGPSSANRKAGSPSPQNLSAKYSLEFIYFYQKGCPKCDRANSLLNYLSQKYPEIKVKEIDINTPEGKRLNETLCNRINLPDDKRLIAPTLFVEKDFLPPAEITEAKIIALLQKYEKLREEKPSLSPLLSRSSPAPAPSLSPTAEEMDKAEESIVKRFRSLGILTLLSAGLIDGINPCAFATLIFFISYLTMVGRKRAEILWVGIGFSGAVFLTYLLIGFGILRFIQHVSFLPLFSKVVYLLTTAFAFVLGILSLYDYIQLRRGKPSEMKLQLPDFLKKRIHRTIREESKSTRYFLAAVAAGFVISLLEFTCTGQVYLPTILFVTHIPSLKANALSYLILYNIMFIVPLLIIFGVVYWGVTSEQLAAFLKKRTSVIKLFTALFFFALAGILIASLL
jgi:thiol-disulfide isomerase/thioredoxin